MRESPSFAQNPDVRKFGADFVSYIRKYVGKDVIKRWEMDDLGKIRLYFGVLHHNPHHSRSGTPLWRIIQAAEKFRAEFRMFADGNLICIELEKPK